MSQKHSCTTCCGGPGPSRDAVMVQRDSMAAELRRGSEVVRRLAEEEGLSLAVLWADQARKCWSLAAAYREQLTEAGIVPREPELRGLQRVGDVGRFPAWLDQIEAMREKRTEEGAA